MLPFHSISFEKNKTKQKQNKIFDLGEMKEKLLSMRWSIKESKN